ncbi:hypothetical protein X801_02092, partial [Opisthorchis viverrini]
PPQNYERYLEDHNKYRRLVLDGKVREQPQATFMYKMKWNAALALLAQRSAEECNFEITGHPTTNVNKAASPVHNY